MPENLDAFRIVLSTARAVLQLAAPWNLSITALQLFLENIAYGFKHFSSQKEHVKQLMAFCDLVLLSNAKNWQMSKPCLNAVDLTQLWQQFVSGRVAEGWPRYGERETGGRGGGGGRDSGKRRRSRSPGRGRRRDYPALKEGALCGRFNDGSCTAADDKCFVRGFKLRHRCSYVKSNGDTCEEKHARTNHK